MIVLLNYVPSHKVFQKMKNMIFFPFFSKKLSQLNPVRFLAAEKAMLRFYSTLLDCAEKLSLQYNEDYMKENSLLLVFLWRMKTLDLINFHTNLSQP